MAWQGVSLGSIARDGPRIAVLSLPLIVLGLCGDWWAESPLTPVLSYLWLPFALAVTVILGFGLPVFRRGGNAMLRLRLNPESFLIVGATAGLALALWQFWHLAPRASAADMLLVWQDAAFAASLVGVAVLGDIAARVDPVYSAVPAMAKSPSDQPQATNLTIAAGDLIPVDGVVRDGRSEIQDPIGADDIFPTVVIPGDRVHAGARNGDFPLVIIPSPDAKRLAQPSRAGDEWSAIIQWAGLAMLFLAVLAFGWRYVMGPTMPDPVAIALRLVMLTTPLGLGLAVAAPAAELLRATRQSGFEVHDLAVLARLQQVGAVVFGHRGVLIPERHRVIAVQTPDGDGGSELIARAASVAQAGHDPWGRAVLDMAVGYRMRLKNATNYHAVIGEGISADVADRPTLIGSRAFLEGHGIDCGSLDQMAEEAVSQGRRLRWVGEGGSAPKVLGFIAFGAPSVAGAAMTVKNLRRLGIATSWIGDGDDRGHVALYRHLKLAHMLPMSEGKSGPALAEFGRRSGPLLLVAAEPLTSEIAGALGPDDLVLPFGRRASAQYPTAPLTIARQDPRLVVDILRLAGRYRRVIHTNTILVFAIAAFIAFAPFLMGTDRDLGSYEIAVILLLAVSSLSLRAVSGTANEVDEE